MKSILTRHCSARTVVFVLLAVTIAIGLCGCNGGGPSAPQSTADTGAASSGAPNGDMGSTGSGKASNAPAGEGAPGQGNDSGASATLQGMWSATGNTQGASLTVEDNDIASFTYVNEELTTVSYDGPATIGNGTTGDGTLVINDKLSGQSVSFTYSIEGDVLTLKMQDKTFTLKRK